MAFGYDFTCDRCERTDRPRFRPCSYVLSDGTLLPMSCSLAWCAGCGRIVAAETLAPMDFLMERLAYWRNAGVDDPRVKDEAKWRRSDAARVLAYRRLVAEKEIEWRRTRSEARCLECGSTALTPISDGETPAHHGCGGTFRQTGFIRFSPATHDLFDANAVRIDSPSGISVAEREAELMRKLTP